MVFAPQTTTNQSRDRLLPITGNRRSPFFFVQKTKTMTEKQFQELVGEMRFNQKQYFKTRSQAYLRKSQELERRVDSQLKNNTATEQGELFNV